MSLSEFEKIVNAAVERIPGRFKDVLVKEDIRLLAREKAPLAAQGRSGSLIFGMFIGVPYKDRSVFNVSSEPTRIELYKDSFEKTFDDGDEMAQQITATVAHEIGHYFGFSEKELRKFMGE